MISYAEALQLIASSAQALPTITVARENACGCVAAEDLLSTIEVPSFANSAMDGFALAASLTRDASAADPLTLPVSACLAAGEVAGSTNAGSAVEIMTGAMLPPGCDCVVPIEKLECVSDAAGKTRAVRIRKAHRAGENVRRAGEDFSSGQVVVAQGTRIAPGHIAALSAAGVATLRVRRPPAVSLIATGLEVSDRHGETLAAGQIWNANVPYLSAALGAAGIATSYAGNSGDDGELFARQLDAAGAECDDGPRIVISCGAVSKGKRDFIPEVLAARGARIVFHGVAIRPGKPVLFAILADGGYFFGLPGNPAATAAGLRFLVVPLLRQLLAMPPESYARATSERPLARNDPLRHFLKARVDADDRGRLVLKVLDGQESFRIAPLAQMNCWAMTDENTRASDSPGDTVAFAPCALFPAT